MEDFYRQSLKAYFEALLAYNKILDLKIAALTGGADIDSPGTAAELGALYRDYSEKIVSALKPLLVTIMETDFQEMPVLEIQKQFRDILGTVSKFDDGKRLDLTPLKDMAVSCYLKLDPKSSLPQYENLRRTIAKVLSFCSAV